jgi:hypothetical protein
MLDNCIKETSKGVELRIYATPRASKTEIVDLMQDKCRIRVKAPPVEGEANSALIKFLAKTFGISKSKVILVKGQKSKTKCFCLMGIELSEAIQKLKQHIHRDDEL